MKKEENDLFIYKVSDIVIVVIVFLLQLNIIIDGELVFFFQLILYGDSQGFIENFSCYYIMLVKRRKLVFCLL